MATGDESDIYRPPPGKKQPWRAEQTAAVFTVFLVIAFILANMLGASMVVVYLVPSPPYPIGIVNTPGMIGLVVLIGIPLLLGERRYVLPWRRLVEREGGLTARPMAGSPRPGD